MATMDSLVVNTNAVMTNFLNSYIEEQTSQACTNKSFEERFLALEAKVAGMQEVMEALPSELLPCKMRPSIL